MQYDFRVSFSLPGGATQIMYFTKDSSKYIYDIQNDLKSTNFKKERL